MNGPVDDDTLASLCGLDLRGAPSHVASAYRALLTVLERLDKRVQDDLEGLVILADRYRAALAELDRLTERAERAEQTIANSAEIIAARDAQARIKDQAIESLRRTSAHNQDAHLTWKTRAETAEKERAEARELLGTKVEWTIGCTDIGETHYFGAYTEAEARRHAAMRRQGEHFPAFRRVGNWQRATADPQAARHDEGDTQ